MKKSCVFLLATLLSFGISLHAQDTPELIEDKIVFADHEEYTSAIKDLPTTPTLKTPVVFEIEGYRFTFDKDWDNNRGGIFRDYMGRLLVLPYSSITVERLDGNAMRSIFMDVALSTSGGFMPGYDPITYFKGKVDGVEVAFYSYQFNSTSITVIALPSNNNKGNCYYFTGMTIKRENSEPEARMAMDLTIDEATAIGSRTAIIDFTLSVTNDDGILDFTITATDEEGEEHGSRRFTRAELEEASPANIEDDEASNDDSNYTLHGRMELTNLKKNERQNLTFALVANYDDRESVPCATTPVYEVNTIGATAIDDTLIDTNDPIEYFNLQGIKVSNPTGGIFIVKRGTTATKTRIP